MPQTSLPEPIQIETSLADVLRSRHSGSSGDTEVPLTLPEIGTVFGLALRKHPNEHNRNYPSGGALYPIETYLISRSLESQEPGVFHYNPTTHALERLCGLPERFDMKTLAKHPPTLSLSSLVVFTSVWQRSSAKYGELAYQHALIESGHMSENVLLVANTLGIQSRPYAGFSDTLISELLDLDDSYEQPVHSITFCKDKS